MPLLYSLGQHGALEKVQAELQEDEVLLALLDDTHIVTSHERTATAFATLQGALMIETGIHLNPGKTKIWSAAGVKPAGCDVLQQIAEMFDPTATVWRGSDLPTCQQGMKILGTPLGHPDFVRASLESQNAPPEVFGQNPSAAGCSWLLLSIVCSTG